MRPPVPRKRSSSATSAHAEPSDRSPTVSLTITAPRSRACTAERTVGSLAIAFFTSVAPSIVTPSTISASLSCARWRAASSARARSSA
ncbi:MAG: hypothetical protein AUG00_03425 [Candidatus Rokubacteria bacterium 13_1_20CM_2_70_7]|nr:MAG: hypothetical protein AUG00_03425 [Candidatus Rokubacteria bacterium 13_1_20CM_2_70_7]